MFAKKKSPKRPPKAVHATLAGSSEVKEPTQVNLLDSSAVKRELDEAAVKAIKKAGFQEDHFVSNVKIVLGLAACAIALVAQFYPGKHHDNWWLLLFCVISYAICTAALSVFLARFEKDSFFWTLAKKDCPPLCFTSDMPRHTSTYTLNVSEETDRHTSLLDAMPWIQTLSSYISGWQAKSTSDNSREQELTAQVTKYFHSDGYLDGPSFSRDVQKLLLSMQARLASKIQ